MDLIPVKYMNSQAARAPSVININAMAQIFIKYKP